MSQAKGNAVFSFLRFLTGTTVKEDWSDDNGPLKFSESEEVVHKWKKTRWVATRYVSPSIGLRGWIIKFKNPDTGELKNFHQDHMEKA